MFDRGDVIAGFEQTGLRSGIKPGHPAAEQFHVELVLLEIKQIQIGDLKFAARRTASAFGKVPTTRSS